ncbi:MAG: hypothetical protein LUQ50_02195, partial [Methanospirillum sp.]|uniref:hypothetical protein n=1 Tax=Methanospirillum sp. TaxID=45200 RepID=UPI00236F2327
MAGFLKSPHSIASGVGSLPHTDPVSAVNDVLRLCPAMPYAPTLPNISPYESIIWHDSENLPGRVIEGNKLYVDRALDFSHEMEQVYLDFMELHIDRYIASPEYGAGYYEMATRDLSPVWCAKCQVTGPVTFGLTITDQDRRPLAYDAQYFDMLTKMLALRARWYEMLIQKTGAPQTLVVIDEPYLAALGSSVMQITPEMVRSAFEDIGSLIEGGIGVHCCSNTDWGLLMSLQPALISLDAYGTAKELLLYRDQIRSYLEKGGIIAWGVVPAELDKFNQETTETLWKRYLAIRTELI